MSASPLGFLRTGPPPPKAVLLPDGLFFSRAVPVAAGATAVEAAAQVELALESIAPFPIAQLYYGWYWVPGSERAFVYAAYRRRFTTEQSAGWSDAELVVPESVALFGGNVQPATAVLLASPAGLTAIYWETPAVPSRVLFQPIDPEATEEERTRVRDELLRSLGGTKTVIDLLVPPTADASPTDREVVFRSGDFVSRLPQPVVAALDVRDKGELETLRAARKRDLVLWRVVLGCAAALLLLLLGEFALLGGQAWQKVRIAKLNAFAPTVQKIKEAQELAINIQDLVTRRFLPLEMVTSVIGVNADRKPADLVVTRINSTAGAATQGRYSLSLEMQTTNSAQVPLYRTELQKLPECESVNIEPVSNQGDRSTWRVTITFKPGVLKPESA